MVPYYLVETLREEEKARKEVFQEMLTELELMGKCRGVYHSLAYVLLGDALAEDTVE